MEGCQQRTRKRELKSVKDDLKIEIGEAKKECVERICEEIMEFQGTGQMI